MVRGLEEVGGMPDSRGSSPVRGAPVQLPQVLSVGCVPL